MKTPTPPIYHGDAKEDGRYYHALADVHMDANEFFGLTGHSLADHFERYGWRAADARQRRAAPPRKNLFVQALFRDAEPSKRELRRVLGVAEALHGQRLCVACADLLSTPARVICERCVP